MKSCNIIHDKAFVFTRLAEILEITNSYMFSLCSRAMLYVDIVFFLSKRTSYYAMTMLYIASFSCRTPLFIIIISFLFTFFIYHYQIALQVKRYYYSRGFDNLHVYSFLTWRNLPTYMYSIWSLKSCRLLTLTPLFAVLASFFSIKKPQTIMNV